MQRAISFPWLARARGSRSLLLATAAACALAACGPSAPPEPPEPSGLLMVGRSPDLARLLGHLAGLEGTPLGRSAAALAERLPTCGLVEARAADGRPESLAANLRCAPPRSELARLHGELGSASVAFVAPESNDVRVRGRISIDALDETEIELTLPAEAARGGAALLLPGDEAPGPGVLSGSETLLHARLRPAGGLDLAELVPSGGQGDRMFRLKSRLFAGAVLDGTWEAAVYLPASGAAVPHAALALGFRAKSAAVAAADEFVAQLEATWSIRRAPHEIAGARGACLPELRILPEFAPCYVATERALVIGYNPESLAKALDGDAARLGPHGGLVVDLGRFPEADARLARAAGAPVEALPTGPWRRLRAAGRTGEETVSVRLHLEAGDGV
jgi:hypothetical protein